MLTCIIRTVVRYRAAVLVAVAVLAIASISAIQATPLDAIPDVSDPQIVVYAKWPRSPELIEAEVTEPLIGSLIGTAGIKSIRSTSHLGYAFIYVILEHSGQRRKVRQLVADRIDMLRARLPADVVVELGPDASSLGWIFEYALVDRKQLHDLRELRLLNQSTIEPVLETVAGVAEVASVGGLERQVELKIFPPLLEQTGITLRRLATVLDGVFRQVGGRSIEITNRDYQLRGIVDNTDIDKLEYVVVGRSPDGHPVHLKDIGYLQVNYDLRRGIADLDGEGEVVGGIVIMEQGRNVITVSDALEDQVRAVQASLPEGVEIVTTYDRSTLIRSTLENFLTALAWELIVVVLVIVLVLRNVRAAVAPVAVILLGTLFTVIPLALAGQTINLLSLAGLAIAIGEMADATIVIVENCTVELSRQAPMGASQRIEAITRATARMIRPLLFSLLIILASFLPVFFLGEREGRLFDPLAFSKTYAMGFSTLLTLFFLPAIIVWVFGSRSNVPLSRRDSGLVRFYRRTLESAIRFRYPFLAFSVVLLALAVVAMEGFERDYMPEIEEGSILYMPTTLPGLPTREAGWILQQIDAKLKSFPEVSRVFGKLGRADTSTDPAPLTMIETTVLLKPESQWRPGMTKQALVGEMDAALEIVGYANAWTQPIAARVMMQDTGIQTPVGVKVKGASIGEIEQIGRRIEELLRSFPGTSSVIAERISEGYYIDVRHDPEKLAEHGVLTDEAQLVVRYGIGGDNITSMRQPDNTLVPLAMQYSPEYIDTLEKIRSTPVMTVTGGSITLGSVADVSVRKMPEMLRNDDGQLAGYVYIDIRDTTAVDYVNSARAYLADRLDLPAGYSLEWTGTYRYAQEARSRLSWIVPVTLVIMFALLMMAFRSIEESMLVLFSTPFALIGGVVLQWLLDYPLTTAVIIGYIAVLAVAIQTGIIMMEFIRDALANRRVGQSHVDAVIEGAVARLRPKLMTVATTVLGLVPIMLFTGSGMDIAKPIALPTVGGMLSSTLYVLYLIPCLIVMREDCYRFMSGFRSRRTQ